MIKKNKENNMSCLCKKNYCLKKYYCTQNYEKTKSSFLFSPLPQFLANFGFVKNRTFLLIAPPVNEK